jgi:hypothetical protein
MDVEGAGTWELLAGTGTTKLAVKPPGNPELDYYI